jgi:hypothetical protein
MAINIKVGTEEDNAFEDQEDLKITVGPQAVDEDHISMNLKARKSLNGNIMLFDHKDIDIVIIPEKMKIVTFPKNEFGDYVYAAQARLFDYLIKKGVVIPESVRGGNVHGSFEAKIQKPINKISIDQIALFSIGKFLEEEKPSLEMEAAVEEMEEQRYTDPEDEDATELGEIPHAEKKGSIVPTYLRRYIGGF